ncbi:branched-chain amino acid ABC transporter permease [Bradyrhizobium sp. AUGA SZCCT0169]|uniref:branched-chain amino acid ABC transporter permease n=1 Tax=Bradyrhizobium sp. AUGA SZCCT0169 TaxID=2807663 RepID=UPI001BA8B012|nr:branched-chain amino acid ABC transporter permease [Bradyrhizobium sp. AUGA SZCCT0169]MBR1251671.1 branched-chain amino acid ABC transporter permease [Bradyrhizobium sp. AUGA SZCCT0169]
MSNRTTTAASERVAPLGAIGGSSLRLPLTLVAVAIVFVVGAVAPTRFAGDFVLRLANEGLLLGMLALSVAFLMNQAGLVALGAASIYGGSGLLFAIAMNDWNLTPAWALCTAFLIIVVYATVLGALIVRTNPLAFMMLTLAAGEMISHAVMLEALRDYTGGADGLVVSFKGTVFGMEAADFASPARFWMVMWVAAWLSGLALWAVGRSRLGAILRAVRENEERMRFSGFDTYLPRLIAYALVNIVAAVAGLLHVLNAGFVSPESLGISVSTNSLVAALMGGIAGSVGPLLGGVIFSFAQDEFGARGLTQLLTGIAIVVFIVVFPRGVVGGLSSMAWLRKFAFGGRRETS